MSLLVRSVRITIIIALLGLCACRCSADRKAEDYDEGNDQPVAAAAAVVSARKSLHDVSILKQIHRHDRDGSYTYGYEGSDGSFKIETKTRSGRVTGKYGYVDDSGKLRVVEYGADEHGFQPSGEGITVPSPTLVELPRRTGDEESNVAPPTFRRKPARKSAYRENVRQTAHAPNGVSPVSSDGVSPVSSDGVSPVSSDGVVRKSSADPGSYRSVQHFGRPEPYQTSEEPEETVSYAPEASYPVRRTGRNGDGAASTGGNRHRAARPHVTRSAGVLDRFRAGMQYAPPATDSGSRDGVSFGLQHT